MVVALFLGSRIEFAFGNGLFFLNLNIHNVQNINKENSYQLYIYTLVRIMANQTNENADIEYLVNTLSEELNLIDNFDDIAIDPQAKQYLKCFAKYSSEPQNRQDIVNFIDYGIKIMGYLKNKEITEDLLSNETIQKIVDQMIDPEVLIPTIEGSLKRVQQRSEKDEKGEEQVNRLREVLVELKAEELDKQKIKRMLGDLKNIDE